MNDLPDRTETEWRFARRQPRLGAKEVHVWRAGLQVERGECERLGTLLSADERERAARFRLPDQRRRFLVARGILRDLLGRYLQRAPNELRFGQNRHGKPYLMPDVAEALCFNLAHSGDMALFGLADAREVGVDIEQIRNVPSSDQIAERFFTPAESARLRSLPSTLHAEAFFECWVQKEAFVKAIGRGVSFGLDRIELPVPTGDRSSALMSFTCPTDPDEWSLAPLYPGTGYIGAVVAAGNDWHPVLWQWPPETSEPPP